MRRPSRKTTPAKPRADRRRMERTRRRFVDRLLLLAAMWQGLLSLSEVEVMVGLA